MPRNRNLPAIVLALAGLMAAAPATYAASVTSTGTVNGTVLSASTSATPSFSADLDSGDSTQTYTVPLTVQDTRGTGAGWNLTATSTTFSTGGGTPRTLSTSASSLTAVNSSCTSGTCTNPSNAQTYPIAVPAGTTAPTAIKFFNTTANNGMGRFTITPTIGVTVPQNAFAGTYSSTVTLSVITGP
ncbi:MAG: WxL domain-containing protein [Solirubrobacteraceae bacterium]